MKKVVHTSQLRDRRWEQFSIVASDLHLGVDILPFAYGENSAGVILNLTPNGIDNIGDTFD